ncbi:hypothetical protein B0F90DRAFT_41490 [Multifurca ochricompacta]|uniref:Uncharacterized protein n=1 Tax=Multifurca ochricompacta TaxID=376703 RepID=A0AAD4MD21_9AGAM|nr:hypothetical protein B0F90DRAFT_41490 [Multifurca ochricompacta]
MKQYPCHSQLYITCQGSMPGGDRTISIRLEHHMKHVHCFDVTLPPIAMDTCCNGCKGTGSISINNIGTDPRGLDADEPDSGIAITCNWLDRDTRQSSTRTPKFLSNHYLILFQPICTDMSLITFLFKINIITNHSRVAILPL